MNEGVRGQKELVIGVKGSEEKGCRIKNKRKGSAKSKRYSFLRI